MFCIMYGMRFVSRIPILFQALAVAGVSVLLFASVFSVTFGMQADEFGNMSHCPFMVGYASVCPMGVIEHIAKWQRLFTATFPQSGDLTFLIFLLFSSAFVSVFVHAPNIGPPALAFSPSISKNKPETKLFNYFVIIFSQGILNPRLYA